MTFFKSLFIGLTAFIGSVFGFGNKTLEVPVPTASNTPIVEQSPSPTPRIIYITVTPRPTAQATIKPVPTQVPTPTPQIIYVPTTPKPTPIIPTLAPTPDQNEIYKQRLTAQINNILQQRYQELLAEQQQRQQYTNQLNSLVQQINQIKADYYIEVERIQNRPVGMSSINGEISRLTQDTNMKINQLTSQYNLLLSQQGAPLNYQVSQSLILPDTRTSWRIEGSLNGMSGTISGSNGESYRWDCVNYTSCTLY